MKAIVQSSSCELLLEPLLILGDEGEHDDERDSGDRWKEFYALRPEVIATCVIGIFNFWKDYQDRKRPQPRRDRRPKRWKQDGRSTS